jgi:hypothetical protein
MARGLLVRALVPLLFASRVAAQTAPPFLSRFAQAYADDFAGKTVDPTGGEESPPATRRRR